MQLYAKQNNYQLYQGSMLDMAEVIAPESIDAIITDPPYLLSFMGKKWDNANTIDPAFGYYFSGLVDGEGCFRIHRVRGGEYYSCVFQLKLRKDDRAILETVRSELGIGRLQDVAASGSSKPATVFIVDSRDDCNKLASFFLDFPLRAKKQRDFFKWLEALDEWNHQVRGNRWHGKTDVSKMEKTWLEMKEIRKYQERPPLVNKEEFYHYLWAKRAFEALKPGGYLLSFGGSRTYHRLAAGLEDAGFEIRDCIMWLYGSGFPKSMNIGLAVDKKRGVESEVVGQQTVPDIRGDAYGTMNEKQGGAYKNITRDIKKANNEWAGWGSCLKPSYEPIIVARKPFKGSLVDNVLVNGVGGLNIGECRVAYNEPVKTTKRQTRADEAVFSNSSCGFDSSKQTMASAAPEGRFPANVIHDGSEEACAGMPITAPTKPHGGDGKKLDTREQGWGFKRMPSTLSDNGGSAARYFYCAKASKRDRDEGLDEFEPKERVGSMQANVGETMALGGASLKGEPKPVQPKRNTHPTVKPTSLMQYLVRLVAPKGATILDPFMGSGSTGKAVMYENKDRGANYNFIGVELTEEYLPIAEARIKYAAGLPTEPPTTPATPTTTNIEEELDALFDF